MTYNRTWSKLAVAAVLCGLAFGQACKSDSNDNPTPSTDGGANNGNAGKGGSGGKAGNGGNAGKGGGGGTGGSSNAGSGDGEDSGVVDAGEMDAGNMCLDHAHNDCVKCDPETTNSSTQFLNHCTEATCQPYDNSKLTAIINGVLPAIP
jgi:hypothetical protein